MDCYINRKLKELKALLFLITGSTLFYYANLCASVLTPMYTMFFFFCSKCSQWAHMWHCFWFSSEIKQTPAPYEEELWEYPPPQHPHDVSEPRPRTNLLLASKTVASDDLPHLLFLFDLWVALHHVLQRGEVQIQLLCQMLKQRKKGKQVNTKQVIHLPVQQKMSMNRCRARR